VAAVDLIASQEVRVGPDGPNSRVLQSLLVRSPYVTATWQGIRQPLTTIVVHSTLFIATLTHVVIQLDRSQQTELALVAVLVSSTWLVLGPYLMAEWSRRLARLEDELALCLDCDIEFSVRTRRRLALVQWVLIAIPPTLMVVAYQTGNQFVEKTLGIQPSSLTYWVGQLVLVVGGFAAGWGLANAAVTLHIGRALAIAPSAFNPYAGVTLAASHHLAKYCFSSAMIFGAGAAALMPSIVSGADRSTGVTWVALAVAIVLMVGATVALLAIPASYVSNRYSNERDQYLTSLSQEIGILAERASGADQGFTNDDYVRLRALLELRRHVVDRSIARPALEMTRRIPVAIVLPIVSAAGSLASVIDLV
jgi:hypothetical protein